MTPSLNGLSIARFVEELQLMVNRPVFDKTSLPDVYDIALSYVDESLPPDFRREVAADAVPLFTALSDQLGLKLEAGRGAVDVLVIDSIHPPTEN